MHMICFDQLQAPILGSFFQPFLTGLICATLTLLHVESIFSSSFSPFPLLLPPQEETKTKLNKQKANDC